LPIHPMSELIGGDPIFNATAIIKLLEGKKNAYRDIVLINAAAALMISNKTDNIKDAVKIASSAIDSGAAKNTLEKLIKLSK